jgi:hypothetical protein
MLDLAAVAGLVDVGLSWGVLAACAACFSTSMVFRQPVWLRLLSFQHSLSV